MHELSVKDAAQRSLCTFRAGDQLYGIDVSSLREISTNTAITPVPPAPPAVRGLANLRSRVLLVLDLRPMLGLPPIKEITPDNRLIILKPVVAEDVGLLVDSGGDIVNVTPANIETAKHLPEEDNPANCLRPIVGGVCKLERELLMIIDATQLSRSVASLL